MLHRGSDPQTLCTSGETSDNDCEEETCHGKNRVAVARHSEGYGTEEECVLSDPQGGSDADADADIEDTDCRLHEPGLLQRISSRRRRRPRVARQDTTESEDDGGRSHRSHRWNLRLSPHQRTQSRTILEESVSQVRPLVICRPNAGDVDRTSLDDSPRSPPWLPSRWSSSLALLLFLLFVFALVVFVTS